MATKTITRKTAPKIRRVEVFPDVAKLWRWHWLTGNHKVVSTSAEGYTEKRHALRMATALHPGAKIVEVEG